jgi:hypothetical protein
VQSARLNDSSGFAIPSSILCPAAFLSADMLSTAKKAAQQNNTGQSGAVSKAAAWLNSKHQQYAVLQLGDI